jgi:hypothetical protein
MARVPHVINHKKVNLGVVTRMRVPSLESQECPFEICFNWIKLNKHVAKKAKLLLCIKVTFCNPNHICKMDTHFHRTALQKALDDFILILAR